MFLKERRLLEKIFNFYDDFDLIGNKNLEEYNFSSKLNDEIKKLKNFKMIIISILIINLIFRGILLFMNKETIIQYILLIITSIIFYMITVIVSISKEDNILFLIYGISSKTNKNKESINVSNIKSVIEEYKDINIHLKAIIEYNQSYSKECNDLYSSFISLGVFAGIILSVVYIFLSIIADGGLQGIIIFPILMIFGSIKTASINHKIEMMLNELFQYEFDKYEYNAEILNNIYKKSLTNENELAFQSYSEMLYMLLDLYQVSIEYEFLSNEDVTCLSKEYSIKINYSINKIKDNTTKNRAHKEYVKLRAFMKENSTEIYNGLETYIGKLYKNIKNSFPSKELKVEDYCFTIDELESLTLLCE